MKFPNISAFSLICIALISLFPSLILTLSLEQSSQQREFVVKVEGGKGVWWLYYDAGSGINQKDSISLRKSFDRMETLKFPLGEENIERFRLDPPDGVGKNFSIDWVSVQNLGFDSGDHFEVDQLTLRNSLVISETGRLEVTGVDPQIGVPIKVSKNQARPTLLKGCIVLFGVVAYAVFFTSGIFLVVRRQWIFSYLTHRIVKHRYALVVILLGGLISCFFAWINGFPLIHADSGMAVKTAFQWIVPPDRTLMYGWFLRLSGFSFNPFFPLVVQGAIASYLVYRLSFWIDPDCRRAMVCSLSMISLLSIFTSYSWFASKMLPDFFCAIAPLIGVVILVDERWSVFKGFFIAGLFFLVNLTHTSAMLISLGCGSIFFCFSLLSQKRDLLVRSSLFLSLSIISYPLLLSINGWVSGRYELLENQPLFMAARFVEMGILQEELEQNPDYDSFKLKPLASEIPKDNDFFLWDAQSVVFQIDHETLKKELSRINHDILRNPKRLTAFIVHGVKQSVKLMFSYPGGFKPAIHAYKNAYVNDRIEEFVPQYVSKLKASRQYHWDLQKWLPSRLNQFLTYLSFIVVFGSCLISVVFFREHLFPMSYLSAICAVVIVNAWICGTLSALHARYNLRASWLAVLAMLLLFQYLYSRIKVSRY